MSELPEKKGRGQHDRTGKKRGAYKRGAAPTESNLQKRKNRAEWRKGKGIQGL